VPRTRSERRLFFLLSVTAGICEELLFRGYVFWFFARWTGAIAGVAIGSVLFGIGHAYLGWKHVIRTTKVGVLFSLITFATGSLWAGMIVHAIMDLLAGDLGFHAFNQPEPESATSLSPTQTSPA